jgi:hypothetical protein
MTLDEAIESVRRTIHTLHTAPVLRGDGAECEREKYDFAAVVLGDMLRVFEDVDTTPPTPPTQNWDQP